MVVPMMAMMPKVLTKLNKSDAHIPFNVDVLDTLFRKPVMEMAEVLVVYGDLKHNYVT